MFLTIFKYEMRYWLRRPIFYIYAAIFFIFPILISSSSAGLFDNITTTTGSTRIANSAIEIFEMFNAMLVIMLILFPSIIGVAINRDYKSEMHTIMYSYPFTKTNYLFAKFLSALVIVSFIILLIGLGLIIGFRFPGTNTDIVGPLHIKTYFHIYFIYLLPNALLFGSIVFAMVTFTRSIIAGFFTVIGLLLISGLLNDILSGDDYRMLDAILNPFGGSASNYYTRYWTPAERNTFLLPFGKVILYNRLFWLSISVIIFGFVYKYFRFDQNAISFSFKKKKGERVTKNNFGGLTKIDLPKVSFDFSFFQNLKTTWKLSNVDFKYIILNPIFIFIVVIAVFALFSELSFSGSFFGTDTLPMTWKMLQSEDVLGLFIVISTFLYAGMLVHRSRIANMSHIVDGTAIPNWTLFVSKLIALIKMQFLLLTLVMLTGVIYQMYSGFYDFEIGHYMFELYILNFINYLIWTLLALFIQTLVRNAYLGLFIMLAIFIGIDFLSALGIEQNIFKYNRGPFYSYSDMNGYGQSFGLYLIYKFYWLLNGILFLILTRLLWVRGIPSSFKERLQIAKSRITKNTVLGFSVVLIAFIGLGYRIYYENNIANPRRSAKENEQLRVDWEKTYKKFENVAQPRIVAVNANMNIFPNELSYNADGNFTMVNKTNESIDSLFVNYNTERSTIDFNRSHQLVSKDTVFNFHIYKLDQELLPGDSLIMSFTAKSMENTFFRRFSPVVSNGTFINNGAFPSFGYGPGRELRDNKTREKYDLPPNKLRPHPSDSTALGNTYISKDADWIDFETVVSTSEDQIAIAPGYLQKEWIEDGRRYFHYKMDSKILNFYAYNSARYEVKREESDGINYEIYYHKAHAYNLDRMMAGMKDAIKYSENAFSDYQHRQARIIEFPRTAGSFAQSFPNTIPFSETIGFIADVDDSEEGGVDYPYSVTAHEIAHQWWAHQVIGADVLGATMLSESLSEYVSLKVLEAKHGSNKMRVFLKDALDRYLRSRTFERKRENALMYNDGQGYIRYQKGSLIFYALSDYIGEESLNNALSKYVEKVKFQEPPYTTSIEMVDYLREATPDSLQYVIKDMFETVTLYDNEVVNTSFEETEDGKYEVEIEFLVSKYRNNDQGKRSYFDEPDSSLSYKTDEMEEAKESLPLVDYIDIGVFYENEDGKKDVAYLKKHKITQINNTIKIIVEEKPVEVGVDPFNKLIDINSEDNRKEL
ncbi:ABC transporter permease/M1 family aminopeptidase [Winogradskyella immobilis]|uniref:Peptidase M1 membrane alanine aminopeptidase domain-containing protein n=1 Tax=Winogradskyella immobilis TaxID=2816852 RepID=A0ABS8ELY0_9FLAO|nr:M1 family aminopeptidase [Winogradskyella immobilis]MCC1484224.1 hypothetical protein [Winogradskyella immobilis]MCG0016316.1 hypothetical protein [Winogradskyella immobilis]